MSTPINRIAANICSADIAASRDFYLALFDFEVAMEHGDWFIQLRSASDPGSQIGILRRDSDWTPERFQAPPRGVVLSIEVPDPDQVHADAVAGGYTVVQPTRDEDYGVRHVLIEDPDGLLVNVLRHLER